MFYDKYKYKWEITDQYGHQLSNQHLREYNLYTVLNASNQIDELNEKLKLNYSLKISNNSFNIHNALYSPIKNTLSIYPLTGDMDIRVKFKASSIEECEYLLDLVMKGNNLELMPLNKK